TADFGLDAFEDGPGGPDLVRSGRGQAARDGDRATVAAMAVDLSALPSDRTALQPHIPRDTLDLHHGGHHRAHVEDLSALAAAAGMGTATLEELVRGAQGALQQHAAQAWNLAFQWRCLKPAAAGGGGEPEGELADALVRRFGDVARFRQRFAAV